MSKTWIILKSEFIRRVKTKWFVFTTLLAPLVLISMVVLPGLMAYLAAESNVWTVAVVDDTGVLLDRLLEAGNDQLHLVAADAPIDSVRSAVRAGEYDGYLHLPVHLLEGGRAATYYSPEGGGFSLGPLIEGLVDNAVEKQRVAEQQVPQEVLNILNERVSVRMVKLTEGGEETANALVYSVIGYVMGMFIYMTVFIYGALVMHAVIEEKNSRVVEVIVSSARPFQLLMGKVLGIGAMGLLQMATWVLLILAGLTFAGSLMALFLDPGAFNLPAGASNEELLLAADVQIPNLPPSLFVWFVLFFLGGYLLYASLFAAIGSTVENQQEAQGLMMPVVFLVLIPIFLMPILIDSPNTMLSIVLAMVPFFSPVLMVVRVAVADVPLWQTVLSFLLLIGGFVAAVWVSSRIYRVGILMYGKKPNLKDLVRWFRYA